MKTLVLLLSFILISLIIVILGAYQSPNFLEYFLKENLLSILSTLIGLNIATVVFFYDRIFKIEEHKKKSLFKNTRKEVSDNLYLLFSTLPLSFIILSISPSKDPALTFPNGNIFYYLSFVLLVFVFIIALFCVLEMIRAIIKVFEKIS